MAWRAVRDLFRRGGVDSAELDARLLAEEAFGMGPLELVNRERERAAGTHLKRLEALAARRLRGEPISRILGRADFWGLTFALSPDTLVPRPETEFVVQKAVDLLRAMDGRRRLLDLGTGSGCIAISILREIPTLTAIATDIAPDAVATARRNAGTHDVARRLDVLEGSWFEPLQGNLRFDLIVANPPYIARQVIETLAPEVRDHDPHRALDGGMDGLDAYREILPASRKWLKSGGALIVEIGYDQMAAVKTLFREAGFRDVLHEKDLAGLDRVVVGYHS